MQNARAKSVREWSTKFPKKYFFKRLLSTADNLVLEAIIFPLKKTAAGVAFLKFDFLLLVKLFLKKV